MESDAAMLERLAALHPDDAERLMALAQTVRQREEGRSDDVGTCPARAPGPKCIRDEGHPGGHWWKEWAGLHAYWHPESPPPVAAPVESAPGEFEGTCTVRRAGQKCVRDEGHQGGHWLRGPITVCPDCDGLGLVEMIGPAGVPHPIQCPACGGTGRRDTP